MIRRTQETDAPAIAALDADLFPALCWNENSVRREIKLGWGLVILRKNVVIGYLLARLDGDMADLIRVGISAKYQRRGYGRALLREAIAQLDGSMMLTVELSNKAATSLYLSEGFTPKSAIGTTAVVLVRIPKDA